MELNHVFAIALGLAACVTDLRSRRVPNALTFGAAAAAIVFHAVAPHGQGVVAAVEGWLIGAAFFIVPFALGGLGGGDVKLLAALGAWLGPSQALWTGMFTGIVGGVMAIVVAVYAGYARQAIANVWFLLQHWSVVGVRPVRELSLDTAGGPRLAYALPIFVGMLVTLWLLH